jgi:hypothetical protein
MEKDGILSQKYSSLMPHLTEKQRRLYLATEANSYGYGGIKKVALASGASITTIRTAIKELKNENISEKSNNVARSRKAGGGRKKVTEQIPELWDKLQSLLEPHVRGEPESSLLWTSKSTRKLSAELKKDNINASHRAVAEILRANNFSLQANRKTYEGKTHKDRDKQFVYINNTVKSFQKNKQPVISVDAKKKELIGNFKNNGQEWNEQGNPINVNAYDFPSEAKGRATPYGVYDITNNKGWVNVGIDKDTAEFAVQSIRNWWYNMGIYYYSNATELLITADSGGSNGIHVKLWKRELQRLSTEIGMDITICHFPPGTSKWNKIEHRLFSYLSKNWRGKPLESFEVIVNLIGATKTSKGLEVDCELDCAKYPTGIVVSDKEVREININRKKFHGEWNYTISPN